MTELNSSDDDGSRVIDGMIDVEELIALADSDLLGHADRAIEEEVLLHAYETLPS